MIIDAMLPEDPRDGCVIEQERAGVGATWTTETSNDPFLDLALAADRTSTIGVGTAIAVAFARSPMTTAITADQLHRFSGGRLRLGLGTQVQAHIERRFSMPWGRPVARMREYVLALRAIWNCWGTGEPLKFEGEFYQHTLMSPLFSPGANPFGPPPVYVAGVGARLAEVAGEVADGFLAPPLATREYLSDVLAPAVRIGRGCGTQNSGVEVCATPMVATGIDQGELDASIEATRGRLAFYASTPAYSQIFDLHGWSGVRQKLSEHARRQEWTEMAPLISDSILESLAVVSEPRGLRSAVEERFHGVADRAILYPTVPWSVELIREVHLE